MTLTARADARALPLAGASVDLIVTSPPYFLLREYDAGPAQIGAEATPEAFVDGLLSATVEMLRVLKPKGSILINLGDKFNAYNASRGDGAIQKNDVRQIVARGHGLDVKGIRNKSLIGIPWRYAIRCVDELGVVLRQEIIWEKTGGLPEQVRDRSRRTHETWFHLTKTDRYWFNAGHRDDSSVRTVRVSRYRPPRSWGLKHPAPFPAEWATWAIERWCPAAGVVLDPFGGSGTTAVAARQAGRVGLSLDLSATYCALAARRLESENSKA